MLEFSLEERQRAGLDGPSSGWLSSIANFLAPPAANVQVTSRVDVLDHTVGGIEGLLSGLLDFIFVPRTMTLTTSRPPLTTSLSAPQSLSQAFIRFLEDESGPRAAPARLPALEMAHEVRGLVEGPNVS